MKTAHRKISADTSTLLWNAIGDRQREWLAETLRAVEDAWLSGHPQLHRLISQFRERTALLERRHQGDPDWFTDFDNDRAGDRLDLHSALMLWSSLKLTKNSTTGCWFSLSDALAHKLLATDVRGALVCDLTLPYEAFYIELPQGLLKALDKKTGWHEVRTLIVTKGCITETTIANGLARGEPVSGIATGERLVIEWYGTPNQNSVDPFDDLWGFFSYRINDPMMTLDRALEIAAEEQRGDLSVIKVIVGEHRIDGAEWRKMAISLVLNLCVWLGSDRAKPPQHIHEAEIERLRKHPHAKRDHIKRKIRELQLDHVFAVGTEVTIEPELRAAVRSGEEGGETLKWRTLVRGHWRNQACGIGRRDRIRKWIEPHVRGAALPTATAGHSYTIKDKP